MYYFVDVYTQHKLNDFKLHLFSKFAAKSKFHLTGLQPMQEIAQHHFLRYYYQESLSGTSLARKQHLPLRMMLDCRFFVVKTRIL